MKNNKKILLITGISIIVIAFLAVIYVLLTTPDKATTLTALEKRYVTKNKNNVINFAIPSDVPVFSSNGEGVFFDYLDNFTKDIGLDINKVSYNVGQEPSLYDYKFEITDKLEDNMMLVYKDNYVALSMNQDKASSISDFSRYDIGTLSKKVDKITYYLGDIDASFSSKDDIKELLEGLEKDDYDIVIVPYMKYADSILSGKYNIVYNFGDIYDNYVLTMSENNDTINTIMKKYFELWKDTNYRDNYNEDFKNFYYSVKGIASKDQADLVGKIYTYGYIDNLPFESVVNKSIVGINGEYIHDFASLSGVEFKYKKYNSISDLVEAFNSGEVDIIFNNFNSNNSLSNAYQTVSTYKEDYVILSNIKNNITIDSIKALKDMTVYALEDSDLSTLVKINTDANLKTFKSYNVLLNNIKDDMLIIMDYDTYNYYRTSSLKNYYIIYQNKFDNSYNFLIKNNNSNNTLLQMFNDYLYSQNFDSIRKNAYQNIIINPKNQTMSQTILSYIMIIIPVIVIAIILAITLKKKKEKKIIKKDEKLKYVDILTSLKNRNYLNANIEAWNQAKIYPQAVVIIDLNRLKYINDNFGHEQGDNEIRAAANILIKMQVENSEIMRTDGNEFMIYLIGYKEEQVIAYMRKLYRTMKELPHGFGAAFGYSMIEDDTKLIDDAINEAILDMKSNKES